LHSHGSTKHKLAAHSPLQLVMDPWSDATEALIVIRTFTEQTKYRTRATAPLDISQILTPNKFVN